MALKKSFSQQSDFHKRARAEDRATSSFMAKQDERTHQGRPMTPITGNTVKKPSGPGAVGTGGGGSVKAK